MRRVCVFVFYLHALLFVGGESHSMQIDCGIFHSNTYVSVIMNVSFLYGP